MPCLRRVVHIRICIFVVFRNRRGSTRRAAREIESEQFGKRVFLGNVDRPAIGGGDGGIEIAMRVGKPLRTRVVKIGRMLLLKPRTIV